MDIEKFHSLSDFLRAYIVSLPKKGRGEVSRMARHLRVSPTLISQVLAGSRSLTPEQGVLLTDYLGLQGTETDYLAYLIQHERAGSSELRSFWKKKIELLKAASRKLTNQVQVDHVLNEEDRAVFYSSPLYSAVRLFCSTGEGRKTLEDIAKRFEIGRAKAENLMHFLVSRGLCENRSGFFLMGPQKTHLEEGSPHLNNLRRNWRVEALTRMDDLSPDELMYSVAVSLSKKDFDRLRDEMVTFIKAFLARVHESPAEEIACFNMDFFWIRK